MSMHHERDPEAINAETRPEIGYEYRDISVKGIAVSTLWFFVGSTIVIALTYVGFVLTINLPLRPETAPAPIPQFPNPLLQSNAKVKSDIAEVKRHENEALNSYGWVEKNKGIARMPIEKAMEEVAENGLGSGSQAPAAGETKL